MKVWSISNRKGGAGKSTFTRFCATLLFHILFPKGKKVAVIDFDDQETTFSNRQREVQDKSKLAVKLENSASLWLP